MEKRTSSIWTEAMVVALILGVMLSAPVLMIKNNPYVVFPAMGVAASISILYVALKREMVENRKEIFRDSTWRTGIIIIILSCLDSAAILCVRLSNNLETAMLFNGFQIIFTSMLLTALLAFTISNPRLLIKKEIFIGSMVVIFLLFSVFLSTSYFVNVLLGNYSPNVQRINGIYYELDLSKAGFSWLYPVVKISFTSVNLAIIISSTVQYIKIKNKTIKKYYSVLYLSLLAVVILEIIIGLITYVYKAKSITFFGIVTTIFSFILLYYLIHIRKIFMEMEKLGERGEEKFGKIAIFLKREEKNALSSLRELLEKGNKALIFSAEKKDAFLDLIQKYRSNCTFILIDIDGYRIKDSVFKSIKDLEMLETFPKNMRGIIVYSDSMYKTMGFPCEKRTELIRYYRFLLRVIIEGGLVIVPIKEAYLTRTDVREIENPQWLIKPLIILRLEEIINSIYGKIGADKREKFLIMLKSMEKEGMPSINAYKSRICLDLKADIDREKFSLLVKAMGDRLEARKIMGKEEYLGTVREYFEEYGEDYYATVLTWYGELNFIALPNAREKSMEIAKILAEKEKSVLIVSRINPHILMRRHNLTGNFNFRWLTTSDSELTLYPHLEGIKREIFSFLERHPNGIVVLDGVEYLSKMHGFDALLNLFWILQDRVSTTGAVVLIPINTNIFEKKEVETLKRDFHFIEEHR